MSFTAWGIVVICIAAFFTGVSKSGVPGLVTLLSPLVALIMPVRESTGFLLPILVAGDIMSVLYWRRAASWMHLRRMLPCAGFGVALGYFLMGRISDDVFKPLLGGMIVLLVIFNALMRLTKVELKLENKYIAAAIGVLAGIFTMIANAASPIMTIYLLSMGLSKEDFVGTNAWFFMIINLIKLPFSAAMGLITWQFLKIDLALIPLIVAGGAVGVFFVKKLPQKAFDATIQILAAVAGLKLIF